MSDAKTKPGAGSVLLSLCGFVLFWAALSNAWGYSERLKIVHGDYAYAYISRLVWFLPAVCLLLRYGCRLPFGGKGLFGCPVQYRFFGVVLFVSALYVMGAMLLTHHGFRINRTMNIPLELVKLVLVGFVEETVFRGWGYNALAGTISDRKATAYSSLFFVLLHWPAYFIRLYRLGTFDHAGWLMQSFTAAVWGVLCCLLLKKTKTLWAPVCAHSVYDILSVLFVG